MPEVVRLGLYVLGFLVAQASLVEYMDLIVDVLDELFKQKTFHLLYSFIKSAKIYLS